jgi:hypothetical protein
MAKEREGLLSKEMIAFLRETEDEKRKYKSTYFTRCITDGKQGIEHLAILAQHLPEERRAQIFRHDALRPLIKSILDQEGSLDLERQKIAVMLARIGLNVYLSHIQQQSSAIYMSVLQTMAGAKEYLRIVDTELNPPEQPT